MPSFLRNLIGGSELPSIPDSEMLIQQIAEATNALADERLNFETYQSAEDDAKVAHDAAKGTSDEKWRKDEWVKCMNAVENSKKLIKSYEQTLEMYRKLEAEQKKKKK